MKLLSRVQVNPVSDFFVNYLLCFMLFVIIGAKKPDDETILIVEESESGNIQNGDSMECTPGIKLG